jgi:hypothetical protein
VECSIAREMLNECLTSVCSNLMFSKRAKWRVNAIAEHFFNNTHDLNLIGCSLREEILYGRWYYMEPTTV